MKIGTDGVLLGAWATAENPKTILDIGSGTGLISLMLAQRFPQAFVTGLEIDKEAADETRFNFSESTFSQRLKIVTGDILHYSPSTKYDLIVSNPPFFSLTQHENTARTTARQQKHLSFTDLLFHSSKLVNESGSCAYVIPFESESQFLALAKNVRLFPSKITRVKGHCNAEIKRSLLQLSKTEQDIEIDSLTIEKRRNVYTDDYVKLTQAFYLKM